MNLIIRFHALNEDLDFENASVVLLCPLLIYSNYPDFLALNPNPVL